MQELFKGLAEDDINGHHISFPPVTGCGELQDGSLGERRLVDKKETEVCADQQGDRVRDGRVRKCPVKSGKGAAFLKKPSSSRDV